MFVSFEAHISHTHFWRPPWGRGNQFLWPLLTAFYFISFSVFRPYDSIQVQEFLRATVHFRARILGLLLKFLTVSRDIVSERVNLRVTLFLCADREIILRGSENNFAQAETISRDYQTISRKICR